MKYSILYPYYKRPEQTHKTLESLYYHYSGRTDFEVIFVCDLKNDENDRKLLYEICEQYWYKFKIKIIPNDVYSYSAARPYNLACKHAEGRYLVISNPECSHKTNVLSGMDVEFIQDPYAYVVCACESVLLDGTFLEWYQHTVHSNRKLHFCSALSKDMYNKIGGFDEDFCTGLFFEDNDFIYRILKQVKVVTRDDLIVSHLSHSREYHTQHEALKVSNRILYINKHGAS